MRFGLFFQAPESRGRSHAERYAEMFELIELADSLGFDVAWLAELHFGGAFSLLSNPLMAVPVIAERTRRIRIGTAVTLLPLHHPLSLAEQAATADLLSGGRLEFGVGRGLHPDPVPRLRPARRQRTAPASTRAWTSSASRGRGIASAITARSTRSRTSRWSRARCSSRIRPSASASTRRRASRTSAISACPSTRGRRPPRCPSSASAWGSTAST